MTVTKPTKETDTSTRETKRNGNPLPNDIGRMAKALIDRERRNIRGSWKNIVRMVTKKDDDAPIARALIGRKAPDFKATAVFKNEFKEIQLSQYDGKFVLLFFYPLDFTFVCPTELHAFQEQLGEFKKEASRFSVAASIVNFRI